MELEAMRAALDALGVGPAEVRTVWVVQRCHTPLPDGWDDEIVEVETRSAAAVAVELVGGASLFDELARRVPFEHWTRLVGSGGSFTWRPRVDGAFLGAAGTRAYVDADAERLREQAGRAEVVLSTGLPLLVTAGGGFEVRVPSDVRLLAGLVRPASRRRQRCRARGTRGPGARGE
jgi:hypothetical protein